MGAPILLLCWVVGTVFCVCYFHGFRKRRYMCLSAIYKCVTLIYNYN